MRGMAQRGFFSMSRACSMQRTKALQDGLVSDYPPLTFSDLLRGSVRSRGKNLWLMEAYSV